MPPPPVLGNGFVSGDVIVPPLLLLLQTVFVNIAAVRTVGDDADRAFLSFLNKGERRVV